MILSPFYIGTIPTVVWKYGLDQWIVQGIWVCPWSKAHKSTLEFIKSKSFNHGLLSYQPSSTGHSAKVGWLAGADWLVTQKAMFKFFTFQWILVYFCVLLTRDIAIYLEQFIGPTHIYRQLWQVQPPDFCTFRRPCFNQSIVKMKIFVDITVWESDFVQRYVVEIRLQIRL